METRPQWSAALGPVNTAADSEECSKVQQDAAADGDPAGGGDDECGRGARELRDGEPAAVQLPLHLQQHGVQRLHRGRTPHRQTLVLHSRGSIFHAVLEASLAAWYRTALSAGVQSRDQQRGGVRDCAGARVRGRGGGRRRPRLQGGAQAGLQEPARAEAAVQVQGGTITAIIRV